MPVFHQGYRRYEGAFRGRAFRWWRITRSGFRTVRRWPLVVILICAAFPLAFWLIMVYGQSLEGGPLRRLAEHMGYGIGDRMFYQLVSVETFFAVLLLMVVGSGQIAEDFRTGALQIYMSKPITHLDYVFGKLMTVVLAGSLVTVAPTLILFAGCSLFSEDWTFVTENPWLLAKALAFAAVVPVVLGALVLAISSLGRRGRMVGLVFAGGYFFTMMLGQVLPQVFRVDGRPDARYAIVHVGKCLDAVGASILEGGEFPDSSKTAAWAIVGALLLLSVLVLSRKVRAVEVVE